MLAKGRTTMDGCSGGVRAGPTGRRTALAALAARCPDSCSRATRYTRTGREIHAVTIDSFAIGQHISDVDTDSEAEPARLGQLGVAAPQSVLNRDRTLDGVDDAHELGQYIVARRVNDASPVCGDHVPHQLPVCGQHPDSPRLVFAHEAEI